MTVYRGESPPKKLVRLDVWERVLLTVGPRAFRTGPHLVIASKEGGDVSVLLGLGVPPKNIYAVDIDRHAIAAAKRKFPDEVNWLVADFADALEMDWELTERIGERGKICCSFIDLCGPIRPSLLPKIWTVGKRSRVLAYEFMVGREQNDTQILEQLASGNSSPGARVERLRNYSEKGAHFHGDVGWAYSSHSETHYGKPMLAVVGSIKPVKQGKKKCLIMRREENWKSLIQSAVVMIRNKLETGKLLNLKITTVAAIKAHNTRGTYGLDR